MIRIFAFYFLCVGSFHLSSAYDVPNETCYDAPAYDCVPGDFNLTVNATVCRTYATGSLNWTSSIACDGEPFYQCNMAQYIYNKQWRRFDCTFYDEDSPLRVACDKWKNVEYCEFNWVLTVAVGFIACGISVAAVYFVFMANKGNAKAEAKEAYATEILEDRKNKIIEKFKPYTDSIRF